MNPVQALRTDLRRSGLETRERHDVCSAYAIALARPSGERWEVFYRTLHSALRTASMRAPAPDAVRSLLSILEDDLSTRLFTVSQLHELRMKLGISDACAGQSLPDVSAVR